MIWQKCTAGQGTTLGNCTTGSATTYTWSNAISYCESLSLGGRTDWRLPNVNELRSIINFTKATSPSIDSTAFPNTQSLNYCSSSTFSQDINNALYVNFGKGYIYDLSKTSINSVRCVTGP